METRQKITDNILINQQKKNFGKIEQSLNLSMGMILDDKYEIKREIARSGMGIIYEAYHRYMHRKVAVKMMLGNKIDELQLKRFKKEIDAYSRLLHPNVIKLYDAGIYNNSPYIAMEYIEGVDICTYVQQQGEKTRQEDAQNANGKSKGRDWQLCARLVYETALGLEYIHQQKMFHRNIKPSNIMVRSNGSPVIIDLGLVKFNQERSYNLTRSRDIIGTCQYMSIEQARGKRGQIDARSDVYSLGLVLYELLTGQQAYTGKNMAEVFNKIVTYFPPTPREVDAKIPEVLDEITIHATEKLKEKRYGTAQEFADELKKYLEDANAQATAQYAGYKRRIWLQRNKNKIVACCIMVLVLIVIVISTIGKQLTNNTKEIASNDTTKKEKSLNDDTEAIYKLGLMYEEGKGVKQDYKKAFEYYEKAANQGFAEAQYHLGIMYGIQQDLKKAVYWLEQSANQGYAQAQGNLGDMYFKGKGVKQDFKKAVYWFEQLANQGNADAQNMLGIMYYQGQGVKKDYDKAVYWFEQLANQGNADAQNMLGIMYYNGNGVKQDYAKAVYWLEKASNQGNADAQNYLGLIYCNKKSVKQDYDKAEYWLEKSANQGYAQAQYNLGTIYYEGHGKKQDYDKAVYWLEKSANQGYAQAQSYLGIIYYNGNGVKQDLKKAEYWLTRASNQGDEKAQQLLQQVKLKQKE